MSVRGRAAVVGGHDDGACFIGGGTGLNPINPHFSPSVASRCWLSRKQRLVAGCVGNAAGGGRLRRVRRSGGGGECPL
ncbi:MAG: hypothetical protein V1790_07970, partial [Planctomycetota bacterium]